MCSEEIGRHPNHSQLPKLNKVTEIPQIAIPLVDEVLDTLGGGSVFSVFDLFSGFTQLTIHPDTIPLTAFCTPNGLYEWPRMPPGAAGTPAWFVSVLRLVTAGLDNILMYLDAIGPDDCPLHHVATLATFLTRDYASINSSSPLINPGLVPHVLTFWATSSWQMAFAPMTLASPPSPACLCPRVSNSFAAYLAVLVTIASSFPTWPA